MKKIIQKKLITYAIASATAEIIYISFVVLAIFLNSDKFFKNTLGAFNVIVFLMLIIFSIAISTALIFGKPAMLYVNGKKQEALELFGLTLGCMAAFLAVSFVVMASF